MAINKTSGSNNPFVDISGTRIEGVSSLAQVASFLGIPFAKFPERFRRGKLIDVQDLQRKFDATKYGPRCPQSFNGGRERRKHLFKGITPSSTFPTSEFDCLRLNIYAPRSSAERPNKLPVVVWIHGGGFLFGDGNSEYGS
jgi:carboxylesterase type B